MGCSFSKEESSIHENPIISSSFTHNIVSNNNIVSDNNIGSSLFPTARSLSDGTREAKEYYCYCYDISDGDNNLNEVSKFVRLGCRCILHYHCLIKYIRYKLGDRLSMSLNGISCPYGIECKTFKTLDDDEVRGDDTKIYYITTKDLDNIVDYGINNPKLHQYLAKNGCDPITHGEVNDLKDWIDEEKHKPVKKYSDEDYDLFIISTSKACPSCGYRSTHYHGHECHHISPSSRLSNRGGCPNCHVNYCYKCLSSENENLRDRGGKANCRCGFWTNFCSPLSSLEDIAKYVAINSGGIPYDIRCGCVICSDCRYGRSCDFCSGDCCVCRGDINPSPNQIIDTNKKWKAEPLISLLSGGSNRRNRRIRRNNYDYDNDITLFPSWDFRHRNRNRNNNNLWDYCRHGDHRALGHLLQSGNITVEEVNRPVGSEQVSRRNRTQEENRRDRNEEAGTGTGTGTGTGRTALWLACDARHTECVRLLIEFNGIDVNTADSNGMTPLHTAVREGSMPIITLLLSHISIDVNRANTDGRTPLHSACWNHRINVVELLLSNVSISVNCPDRLGYRPLHVACQNGFIDIARILLSHESIDINRSATNGFTPLHVACQSGFIDIVSLLLSNNSDINIPSSDGTTAICIACKTGRINIVSLLLSRIDTIDANRTDSDSKTPLHFAVDRNHKDTVELLLLHGVHVNTPDDSGATPLYIAVEKGLIDIVNLLLSCLLYTSDAADE